LSRNIFVIEICIYIYTILKNIMNIKIIINIKVYHVIIIQ